MIQTIQETIVTGGRDYNDLRINPTLRVLTENIYLTKVKWSYKRKYTHRHKCTWSPSLLHFLPHPSVL